MTKLWPWCNYDERGKGRTELLLPNYTNCLQMSHVSRFQKRSLQTLLGFSGRVSVCRVTHSLRCSRAKRSFWGGFPVELLSLEGSSQGPGEHRGPWWGPLWSDHHNGLEWRQETIWEILSPPWCRKYWVKRIWILALAFVNYMDLNVVWYWVLSESRLWEKVLRASSQLGRWF